MEGLRGRKRLVGLTLGVSAPDVGKEEDGEGIKMGMRPVPGPGRGTG